MKAIALSLLVLFILGLMIGWIIVFCKAVIWFVTRLGEPDCHNCKNFDSDLQYCWLTHTCHDDHECCSSHKHICSRH